ncbi:MAG: type II toxin-antitoxin system VapB family antitoxin [Pseudomonadota bacterium]
MRTTIRLDEHLFEQVKQYALSRGKTFTAVVEDALREKLMGRNIPNHRARVRLKTVDGNGVRRGIDLDDSASLLDAMERPDAAT